MSFNMMCKKMRIKNWLLIILFLTAVLPMEARADAGTETAHNTQQESYFVLDKVYPFCDQEKLFENINVFVDKKVPFVISVMPVYQNTDYPAMKHFCEILRYAQANGGAVILHSPVNRMEKFQAGKIIEAAGMAMDNYQKYGVYPLAVQVPANWMYDEEAKRAVGNFRTVFISEEEDIRIKSADTEGTEPGETESGEPGETETGEPGETETGELGETEPREQETGGTEQGEPETINEEGHRLITSVIYMESTEDAEQIEKQLERNLQSSVLPGNLWDVEPDRRQYDVSAIRQYEPFVYDGDYDYKRNITDKVSKDLSEENGKLLTAVVVVSLLFVLFIGIARRNNKRKFFY